MTPTERARAVVAASGDLFTLPADGLSDEERIADAIWDALEEACRHLCGGCFQNIPAHVNHYGVWHHSGASRCEASVVRQLMEEKP